MRTMLTVENAATWFNAKTVTHNLDVVDRQTASIVDTRTAEGSTVRFYNADGFEFMTLKSDDVSTLFYEDETSDEPWLVIVEPY